MRHRLVLLCLTLTFSGCNESTLSVPAAVTQLRSSENSAARTRNAAALEKALEKDPTNGTGWTSLAEATLLLAQEAPEGQPADDLVHKATKYLKRGLAADRKLADDAAFRKLATVVFAYEAVALAHEKKVTESLAALQAAVDYGFTGVDQIEKMEDFAEVRSVPEFASFLEKAKQAASAAIDKLVARELAENRPFLFDFYLKDVAGNKLSKRELAGKVLIVDVWGTWCRPCLMEIPHFVELDKQYRDKGLQVVGLCSENTEDVAEATLLVKDVCERKGVTYPCAIITEKIMRQIPSTNEGLPLPTTLFLDRMGKVRLRLTGARDLLFLQAVVERLLNEKPAEGDQH